jgi:Polyketide cyclase / dehydrase and lipid transport.
MTTLTTETLRVTIDAPYGKVTSYLADPGSAHEWATEFFAGPLRKAGADEWVALVPMMGGEVRYRQDTHWERGVIDVYLAPQNGEFGPPLPVRVVPNGGGADVLWTLTRFPGMPDEAWRAGLESMQRELENLRRMLEANRPSKTT